MLVLQLSDPRATDLSLTGGKGANLARCLQAGFSVPAGVVLTSEAYRSFVGDSLNGIEFDAENPGVLKQVCDDIRSRLHQHLLPDKLVEQLDRMTPAFPVAVRSSSTLEDLAGAAFAGQHDTILNVTNREELLDAIRQCFASLWEDRAVRYRHEHGFDHSQASMAVVIQQMVQPDAAGVAFCMNPITGDLNQVMINAAPGLGETVVSGDGEIDQYVVEKKSGQVIESDLSANAETPIKALLELCQAVERHYGFPQDIEWASAEGKLYLLQSRPVTKFPPRWTRDESAERFPNPITPLTWDYTVDGFHESLDYSLKLLGMPSFDGRWFDRFDGYIYGNQTAVRLFTSGQQLSFASLDELRGLVPVLRERYGWVQQLPMDWARDLDGYLLRIGELKAVLLERVCNDDLWNHLEEIDALGKQYFRPNIAISLTQGLLHRTLYRLVALVLGESEAPQTYDHLVGFCETKTSQVARDLHHLLCVAREESGLIERLKAGNLSDVCLEQFPGFQTEFQRFLEQHGHREVDYDPYHPTWSERPSIVLENLRLMLASDPEDSPTARERELRLRQQAAELRFIQAIPEDLRFFTSELLRLARVYTSLDDLEHYQTTRLNPLFRKSLLEAGRRLGLSEPSDVFFADKALLKDGLLHGADCTETIAANKSAHLTQQQTNPPWVYGETETITDIASESLHGLPGSPGGAEGPVFLVHSVEDFGGFPSGAVLVARTTNPAWTPLFYSASAVITESGGPLSHGAVTAREIGLPAVMAVRGVLQQLEDGTRVRVDGTHGTVTLLDKV